MITWILTNFRIFFILISTVVIPSIVGLYTFVTLVTTSSKVNAQQDVKINVIEANFRDHDKTEAVNKAILSDIKEDTKQIKDILYKQALRNRQE